MRDSLLNGFINAENTMSKKWVSQVGINSFSTLRVKIDVKIYLRQFVIRYYVRTFQCTVWKQLADEQFVKQFGEQLV